MIFEKIKNLNYLLIFLLILISFIGAAGLYSAADGSYQPWASKHLVRFYLFLLMAIVISLIDIKIIYKYSYALFVGYMPYDDPKYSISVIIEHGGSGASTAAPIAKQIFNYINELDT